MLLLLFGGGAVSVAGMIDLTLLTRSVALTLRTRTTSLTLTLWDR